MAGNEFLLVDGYNIIHAWPELLELSELSLESARLKLMDMLSNYQGYRKITVILVFDAYLVKGNQGSVNMHDNIYVVYTKEAETADNYIERVVNRMPKHYSVRVASSDGLVQLISMGGGAVRMSAAELKNELNSTVKTMRERYISKRPPKNNMLEDNLDEHTRSILEMMRRQK